MAKRKGKKPRPRKDGTVRVYVRRVPRGAPQKRPICIISGKEVFETKKLCWDWIEDSGNFGICVPYRCFDCMKIHQTSNPDTVDREMRDQCYGGF